MSSLDGWVSLDAIIAHAVLAFFVVINNSVFVFFLQHQLVLSCSYFGQHPNATITEGSRLADPAYFEIH